MANLRRLGSTGLDVAPLVAGGNVFGWSADEATSFAVLDAFVAGGVTMIDTADYYSAWAPGHRGGESETIIGKWMKARGNRARVQIATKVGMLSGDGGEKLAPARIAAAVEASLARLQTDHIDLYYAHQDDDGTPQEAVAEAFDRLVKAGKVRAIAASNFSPERLVSALDVAEAEGFAAYGAVQPLFSLMTPEGFPADYRRLCIDRDIGALSYYGLAAGFLTGKYRRPSDAEGVHRNQAVSKYFGPRGDAVLAALDRIAEATGASQAQIALAWVMATPGLTAPIASATSVRQVEELVPAMALTLSAEQIADLNAASAT